MRSLRVDSPAVTGPMAVAVNRHSLAFHTVAGRLQDLATQHCRAPSLLRSSWSTSPSRRKPMVCRGLGWFPYLVTVELRAHQRAGIVPSAAEVWAAGGLSSPEPTLDEARSDGARGSTQQPSSEHVRADALLSAEYAPQAPELPSIHGQDGCLVSVAELRTVLCGKFGGTPFP